MKRHVLKPVGGALLGVAVMLALLPACAGTTPASAGPEATATSERPTPTATAAPTTQPAAPSPATPLPSDDPLALGKLVFEETAGGVGCASCHGMAGKGGTPVGAPDIRGKTEAQVRAALGGGVEMMRFIKLRDDEISAVTDYLRYLSQQP